MSEKKPQYEVYTLILKHEVFDGDNTYAIDEPLVLKQMYNLTYGHTQYALNEMLKQFEREVIQRQAR